MRTLKLGYRSGIGWRQRSIGLALFGVLASAGAGCTASDVPGEPEPSAQSPVQEKIGQTEQAWTDSAYVPSGYYCKDNDEFGGDLGTQANSALDSTKWLFQNIYVNNELENYTTRQC